MSILSKLFRSEKTEVIKPEPVQIKEPEFKAESEPITPIIEPVAPVVEPEPITEEQINKMTDMCKDIHKEYNNLLKQYKDADTDRKVYILKECYRKLDVMDTTISKYRCYYELDTYEEMEKIEKKAKSFINAYIKDQREDGFEDYEIDVTQFSDDLDFICDYIYDKDEKLNKY